MKKWLIFIFLLTTKSFAYEKLMNDVELNHVYVVIDPETYNTIKNSDFVRSLAFTYEQKSGADNETSWEGFYIRGKDTYIELFYPQKRYPRIGISGIGMGVDALGSLARVAERFKKDHPDTQKHAFQRNGVPWFQYVAVGDSYFYERNSFWIMEYAPEYFTERPEDISRAHYNQEKYNPDTPFLNVKKVCIALKTQGLEILSSYLKSAGLHKRGSSYFTLENIEIELFEETKERSGIFQIHFSLNQDWKEANRYQLGSSSLQFEKREAIWTFFPPEF